MAYYITGFQNYLEALCMAHHQVLHQVEPGGTKAFVRFQSDYDISQLTNNPGTNLVVVTRFYGRAIGDVDAQQIRQYIQIRFASFAPVPDGGDFSDSVNTATDTAYTIMLDFLARMFYDLKNDDCGPLQGIELQNCTWEEIPEQPWLQNHFGWDLTIPFKSELPELNATVWGL